MRSMTALSAFHDYRASVPVCGATRRSGRDRLGKHLKLQW